MPCLWKRRSAYWLVLKLFDVSNKAPSRAFEFSEAILYIWRAHIERFYLAKQIDPELSNSLAETAELYRRGARRYSVFKDIRLGPSDMYEANEIPYPFWGAESKTKSGRDPLAVQNSSVVIYNNMITGITNVTGRVRYNGFYCWILMLMKEHSDKTSIPLPEQIKLIRRGELLLAYLMQHSFHEVTGVSGSIFTQKYFKEEDRIDLAWGADYTNKSQHQIYWQYPNGIFGQYYIGVLYHQLNLISVSDDKYKSYRVTPEGHQLAEAYRRSLTSEIEALFWDSICQGVIDKKQLAAMAGGMALHLINTEEELNEYQKIFCKPDHPDKNSRHRINSIRLILQYLASNNVRPKNFVLDFLKYNFESVLIDWDYATDEMFSWFLYELNELSHAAYEAFHFAILYSITEEPQPLDSVLRKLQEEYETYATSCSNEDSVYPLYDQIQECYKKGEYGALLHKAARLLLTLQSTIEPHLQRLSDHAQQEGYDVYHPGFALFLLDKLINDTRQVDWNFVEGCIYFAINDHLHSSYGKSTIGQGLVHNYMVEDELIWKLRNTKPVRTSPRLQNVLQYMEDLQWIEQSEDHYILTDRGLNIMNNV